MAKEKFMEYLGGEVQSTMKSGSKLNTGGAFRAMFGKEFMVGGIGKPKKKKKKGKGD